MVRLKPLKNVFLCLTMQVQIDSREPEAVKQAADTILDDYGVETLDTADFAVPELGIGVERKEASDFASSVRDRRISEQGDRMVEEFSHRYVILEGDGLYNLKYTDISANSLIGQQVSLAAKRDINIVVSPDVEGTVYAVRRIVERVKNGSEDVGYVKTVDVETDDTALAMLCRINGISCEKAERLLDEYYFRDGLSGFGILVRTERDQVKRDLQMLDGIGPVLAERVINAFC